MTLLPTVRGAGSPHTFSGNLWASPSALSLIYSQGHQKWFYGLATNTIPQDPRLRRAPYWGFSALPLLITFWKFFIILSLNLCFIHEVPWCNGACPGAWQLNSQGSYLPLLSHLQGPKCLEPTQPPPFNPVQLPPSAPGAGLSMGMGRVKVRYVCPTHLGIGRGDGCLHSRWATPWHAPWVIGEGKTFLL